MLLLVGDFPRGPFGSLRHPEYSAASCCVIDESHDEAAYDPRGKHYPEVKSRHLRGPLLLLLPPPCLMDECPSCKGHGIAGSYGPPPGENLAPGTPRRNRRDQ
jgi:hypothetical protein